MILSFLSQISNNTCYQILTNKENQITLSLKETRKKILVQNKMCGSQSFCQLHYMNFFKRIHFNNFIRGE